MIALAAETGVAPSVLLGRVVGPTDPAWTDLDLDLVLGFRREQAKTCRSCGTQPEEWVDAEGKELNPPPFEPYAVRDPGCASIEQFRKTIPEGEFGVFVALRPLKPGVDGGAG